MSCRYRIARARIFEGDTTADFIPSYPVMPAKSTRPRPPVSHNGLFLGDCGPWMPSVGHGAAQTWSTGGPSLYPGGGVQWRGGVPDPSAHGGWSSSGGSPVPWGGGDAGGAPQWSAGQPAPYITDGSQWQGGDPNGYMAAQQQGMLGNPYQTPPVMMVAPGGEASRWMGHDQMGRMAPPTSHGAGAASRLPGGPHGGGGAVYGAGPYMQHFQPPSDSYGAQPHGGTAGAGLGHAPMHPGGVHTIESHQSAPADSSPALPPQRLADHVTPPPHQS